MNDVNQEISINIGGAATNTAVVTRVAHLYIASESRKALCLTAENIAGCIWLPKKALVPVSGDPNLFKLASWFKPSSWQRSFMSRAAATSGTSAI